MNKLQFETSPYLLQHAHNPVNWYAWRPEAFERASAEGKPVLVSIGYSTCHWCHVMERESFEDPEVAAFMNRHFINIKVDREERPDVDQIYMDACQAINGSGGWPLNCFLFPDGRPFFAGTYYPPRPAYNRPSWMQLLQKIVDVFSSEPNLAAQQAARLTAAIAGSEGALLAPAKDNPAEGLYPVLPYNIFHGLEKTFDKSSGGFGGAPKFPGAMALGFLLEYHFLTGDRAALEHVVFSVKKMVRGGIYDQLGGGFARYATDDAWLVPHFEKMLYDNALLTALLSDLYRYTKDPFYAETIAETLAFVQREMTGPEGGFYAALDADSEGQEGKFYVWGWDEIQEALGSEATLFCDYYGVAPEGNWEGVNILWRPRGLPEYASAIGLAEDIVHQRLQAARQILFARRAKRVRPGLDTKFLLDWNAMMCSAFARAFLALGDPRYRDAAERNINFLLDRFQKPDGNGLYHTYSATSDGGRAQYDAFLDDYANLIETLLEVYTITFNPFYLKQANAFLQYVLQNFYDGDAKLFYFTSGAPADLVVRKKELIDNATPSGNATMALNLLRLGTLLGEMAYRQAALEMLARVQDSMERYPGSFTKWAAVACRAVYPSFEVAVTGPEAGVFAARILENYLPNIEIMAAEKPVSGFRLLEGRENREKTLIYICRDFSCRMPQEQVEPALRQLKPAWMAGVDDTPSGQIL
ncbi:MAG: thioredoxin domain-containing protein [Saprospiraceae bacterium]